jgi:hypothetical protein
LECQWYEKQDKKSDSRAAEKGAKKSVRSNFAKILEVATKIRETCEKTLFTPPSPIKATNEVAKIASICLAIGCRKITSKRLAIRHSQITSNYLAIRDRQIAIAYLEKKSTKSPNLFSNN